MEKDRNFRSLAVIALIVAIAGISVAFAALSQTLTVTGTGTVKGNTWSVSFANLQIPTIVGEATIDNTATLTNNSTTMNFSVSLRQPGDSVTYLFDITNGGTIDAKVSAISLTGVSEAFDKDVTYTLTYDNGAQISVDDTLNAGTTRNLKLVVKFDEAALEIPETDVLLNLGATIDYTQQ